MKIIITGPHNTNKFEVAHMLENTYEDFSVCSKFSTNSIYEDTISDFEYINSKEIIKAYKNNSFLVINELEEDVYEGITIDNFYANNIVVLELDEFNAINEYIFLNNEIIIVWIDSSDSSNNIHIKNDIKETKYLLERLEYTNYIYFLDEHKLVISEVIKLYYYADDEEKQQIIEKYC